MKTNIQVNDTVYHIDIFDDHISMKEMKVLCVGEKTAFVSFKDPESDFYGETILSLSRVNTVDPSEVFKTSYMMAWADSLEKANELKEVIAKVHDFRNQFQTQVAS
ncbi:hypothetical protein [Chryseobacterium taichungense]|uniref:hypothetical protein n=1 Tax=Chryseobacterium taichungense TaxID=295069 RepID=UPI0028A83CB4|nr:hypothetical protein [Chryseobacterium taichungense]